MMEDPIEVVICHDILEVPFEDTTHYVWAATQTFTIKHVPDDIRGCNSTNEESMNATVDCSDDRMLERLEWLAGNSHSESINIPSSLRIVAVEGAQPYEGDLNKNSQNSIESHQAYDDIENSCMQNLPQNSEDNKLDVFEDGEGSDDKSYITLEHGEYFPCGVCDQLFRNELSMHSHRIEHFGYLHWKYCQNKTCMYCGDPFRDVRSMSNHLYNQCPGMQSNSKKPNKAGKLKSACDNLPCKAESPTNAPPSESQSHEALTTVNSQNAPQSNPDVDLSASNAEHRNYPTTNNDRLDDVPLPINNIIDSSSKYNENPIVDNGNCLQSTFKCGVCDMVFGLEGKMHKHRIRHFGYFRMTSLMKCVFCGDLYSSLINISEHLYQHYLNS